MAVHPFPERKPSQPEPAAKRYGPRLHEAAPRLLDSVKTFLAEHELMGAPDDAPSIVSARALVAQIEGKQA